MAMRSLVVSLEARIALYLIDRGAAGGDATA
jgi:hypothetical protein